MPQYFAAALTHVGAAWTGREVSLDDAENLDDIAELLRDFAEVEGAAGPVVLFVEEADEYVAVVRGQGDADPRVFLSDRRAAEMSDIAAILFEQVVEPITDDDTGADREEDEEQAPRPIAEPAGDASLLADLGTPSDVLLELCAEEGMLPGDVISALCERAGCLDVLEQIREV